MNFIRSIIFNLYFFTSLTILAILLLPLLYSQKTASLASRIYYYNCIYAAKYICGIRFRIEGEIPKKPCIIASKHQSAWETMLFPLIIPGAIYALKKEILSIPIFGWYVKRVGMIYIDRKAGSSALKNLAHDAEQSLQAGKTIAIFPEGTRTKPGAKPNYKSGIAYLYNSLDVDIIPATLNSGRLWGRNSFIKKPGIITVKFLPAMPKNLSKQEFMQELEGHIESNMPS